MSDAESTRALRVGDGRSPLMQAYHDTEWGIPVHDDAVLFEFITLEGAQAGLSWETVLRKRERYRTVFAGFDRARVAKFTPKKIDAIMDDAGVIRHRGKIESVVSNALAIEAIAAEFGSFDAYLWAFIGGKPLPALKKGAPMPVSTPLAEALSKDLRKRGLRFVGPTIVYSFMQAVGMANDHAGELRISQSVAIHALIAPGVQPPAVLRASYGSHLHRHRDVALPVLVHAVGTVGRRARRAPRQGGLSPETPVDSVEENAEKERRINAAFGEIARAARSGEARRAADLRRRSARAVQLQAISRRSRCSPAPNIRATRFRAGSACRSATNAPSATKTPDHWVTVKSQSAILACADARTDHRRLRSRVQQRAARSNTKAWATRSCGRSYYLNPDYTIPTVPFFVNCYYGPQPTAKRCYELGRAVRAAIERMPLDLNVAVIGSGGLWHLPNYPQSWLDEEFDQNILDGIRKRRARATAAYFDSVVPPYDPADVKSVESRQRRHRHGARLRRRHGRNAQLDRRERDRRRHSPARSSTTFRCMHRRSAPASRTGIFRRTKSSSRFKKRVVLARCGLTELHHDRAFRRNDVQRLAARAARVHDAGRRRRSARATSRDRSADSPREPVKHGASDASRTSGVPFARRRRG